MSAPRIYYLFSRTDDTDDTDADLRARLADCRAMGFTHVLMPDPAPGAGSTVDGLVGACRDAGLSLLFDVLFAAPPGRALQAHGSAPDALPDPRRVGIDLPVPSILEGALDDQDRDWHAQLADRLARGVAGFACRGLASLSRDFWRELMRTARVVSPQALFIAWTPGCTPAQLTPLAGCGFDATVASTAWWDYRAPWLAEESARLARVAPPIALVADPLATRTTGLRGDEDEDGFRRRCERTLGMAAASGCGMLMPMGYESGLCDLSQAVTQANALMATLDARYAAAATCTCLGDAPAGVTVLLRQASPAATGASEALVIVINPDSQQPMHVPLDPFAQRLAGLVPQARLWPTAPAQQDVVEDALGMSTVLTLEPGGLQVLAARPLPAIAHFINRGKRGADAACRAPRVAIEAITPAVDGGRFPVKRNVGDRVDIEADVFMDGHDKLGVMLLWRPADMAAWQEVRMTPLGNDRWRAVLPLRRTGRHLFVIQAWRDAFATYRDELSKKAAAGLDVHLELEEGRRMIAAASAHAGATGQPEAAAALGTLAARLAPPPAPPASPPSRARKARAGTAAADTATGTADVAAGAGAGSVPGPASLIAEVLSEDTARAMQLADDRPFAVLGEPVRAIDAERLAARFSSWYELFPRSQSGDAGRHGTFADVEKRLPAIRDMGFDTLYFPPIHPIGRRNRKGRNNSLTPGAGDPGSPYAIGADDGGHDALHAELGTLADFRHLCAAARDHGLEIALDFAIQCSPDHPWIKAHPDWFAWRPDGSMRYAENPPKKYEDIVNVDFYAPGAMPTLWMALRDAVLFWVNQGVRVFRVDNPHTKPLPFWEWMIGDIRSRFPDTLFLSEAFTRPKVMYRLAKVGFSQSYSYFTWRHTKEEFTGYLTELTTTGVQDYFRPNFFVNTPDINPVFLQKSGRPGFLIRAALATLLSGLWGMYSGFELCEATPVPGKEDYLDSEKYEIRAWDWERPGNIIAEITALNRIRRAHPALQSHLGVQFCESSDPNVLCFLRHVRQPAGSAGLGDDMVFVAINLDPFAAHDTAYVLPLWQLGVPDDGALAVTDLLHGNRFTLHGRHQHLRLDPSGMPYVVWQLNH